MDEHGGYTNISKFVMGTRWDVAPRPLPEVFYTYICGLCKATTYTEKEYAQDLTVVCNVCASMMGSQVETDPHTDVVWDLPPDLLVKFLAEAEKQGIPIENYVIGFLEWKTGRELPQIRLYNREDKRIYIVKKREWLQKQYITHSICTRRER